MSNMIALVSLVIDDGSRSSGGLDGGVRSHMQTGMGGIARSERPGILEVKGRYEKAALLIEDASIVLA
jgi:hypothetical protein